MESRDRELDIYRQPLKTWKELHGSVSRTVWWWGWAKGKFALSCGEFDFLNWWHFGLCKLNISKRKIMEAMLMNGKEKHEVFDRSDVVSISQSEFA